MKKFLITVFVLIIMIIGAFYLFNYLKNVLHTHTYSYKYDEEEHWQECGAENCGEKIIDRGPHDFSNGDCVCGRVQPHLTHTLFHVDEVAATCTTNGTVGHWACNGCDKKFADENGENEITSLETPLIAHTVTIVAEVPATCTVTGSAEHYVCSFCSKKFSDENATNEITSIETPLIPHDLVQTAAIPATCLTDGSKEYHTCSVCNKNFTDTSASEEIADIVNDIIVSATGHTGETQWTTDDIIHYHVPTCEHTTLKLDEGEHTYTNRVCTVCSKQLPSDAFIFVPASDSTTYICTGVGEMASTTDITVPSTYNGKAVTEIAPSAFANRTELTGITIPDSITKISNSAFLGCTNLVSITFGTGLTTMGTEAFRGCTSLADITLPDSLTTISDKAFLDCSGLTNVTFGSGSLVIGVDTFRSCTSLADITLPDSLTTISDNAFSGCSGLTDVTFGTGLTTIGSGAFRNCTSLANITFPNSLTTISNEALYGCSGLTDVTFGTGLTTIGNSAFRNCTLLSNVTFEEGLTSIGNSAFRDNTSLADITLPDSLTTISDEVFYGCNGLTSVTFGNGLMTMGKGAFRSCTTLTDIVLPDALTAVPYNAFIECSGLKDITLGSGVTSIAQSAFPPMTSKFNTYYTGDVAGWCKITGLENLMKYVKKLYINSIEVSGELIIPENVNQIQSYAFYNCSEITSITIPNSVTAIGESAFSGCNKIESATLPTSALKHVSTAKFKTVAIIGGTTIEASEFSSCKDLTKVTLADSVTTIKAGAFDACKYLIIYGEAQSKPSGWEGIKCPIVIDCKNNEVADDGYIHVSVDNIGYVLKDGEAKYVQQQFPAQGEVILPASISYKDTAYSLTAIGEGAFSDNAELRSITLPQSILTIGSKAFSGCGNLTKVEMSSNTLTIGENSFSGCSSLSDISIPSSVRSIGANAFAGCRSLISIAISENVTLIGVSAFANCTNLESVKWNSPTCTVAKADSISNYSAFENCTKLAAIEIGANVTKISKNAFYYCDSITSIRYKGDIVSWCKMTDLDAIMKSGRKLYIGGAEVVGELIIPESVTSISAYAFQYCSGINSIKIPNSVTAIGTSAFDGCYNIVRITIPMLALSAIPKNKLETAVITNGEIIPQRAFNGCSSLKSITLPDNITSVGDMAFSGCISIENAVMPVSVVSAIPKTKLKTVVLNSGNSIPAGAFSGCSKLIDITLPNTITSIEIGAFTNCNGLTAITIPGGVTTIGNTAFSECNKLTIYCERASAPESGWDSGWDNNRPIVWDCGSNKVATDGYTYVTENNVVYALKVEGSNYIATVASQSITLSGDITISQTITYESQTYDVTSISSKAFEKCGEITSITLPDTVITIGGEAFRDCNKLTVVTISKHPTQTQSIEDKAFDGSGLTEINFDGTAADWNGITKSVDWDINTPVYTVHCSDTDIVKPAT